METEVSTFNVDEPVRGGGPADNKLTSLNKIEVEFAKMTDKIKEALCNNNISVTSLVEQLCAISAVRSKKVPIFDEDVFEKVKSIYELWRKLRKFWNIFDYDILIFVIDISECIEAQEILNNFLARIDLSAFEDMGLVLHYIIYEEELMQPLLRIKVNTEKCTLGIKNKVKEIVSKKFNLEEYSLRFNGIKDGCIEFVYYLSKAMVSYLLEYQVTGSTMADFAAHNIVSFQIGDMKLNVPTSEIMDMVNTLRMSYYHVPLITYSFSVYFSIL